MRAGIMASLVLVISIVKTPASQFTCLLVRQDNTGMIVHLFFVSLIVFGC